MKRGRFISFEGLDGSGKSTQLRLLAASLTGCGYHVVTARNPGGTPLGDRIRGWLLDSRTEDVVGGIAPEAEMALMFADRAQCLEQIVRPALAAGSVVLCDRFTDSSEAYQGAGRALGTERILTLHRAVCQDQQPDLTVLLLPPLTTSLARARQRNQRHLRSQGNDENRFEGEDDAFFHRVYAQYEVIAAREPARVLTFGGDPSIEQIAAEILSAVLDRLADDRAKPAVPADLSLIQAPPRS